MNTETNSVTDTDTDTDTDTKTERGQNETLDRRSDILTEKTCQLLNAAFEAGFPCSGIIPAQRPATLNQFYEWLDEGKHADMDYLARRRDAYADPNRVLEGVQRLIVLAWPYISDSSNISDSPNISETAKSNSLEKADQENRRINPEINLSVAADCQRTSDGPWGTVAPYACGRDYHSVLREKLKRLGAIHRTLFPEDRCRGCVDTAPILEKDAAVSAGIGAVGWNTCLYCGAFGSRVCLAVLLSTAKLSCVRFDGIRFSPIPEKPPVKGNDCGDCRRCLNACPTGALSESGLDGRLCLNYWLIENKGPIPPEIQKKIKNRAFGCDVCQQVCPRNPPAAAGVLPLKRVLSMTEEEFNQTFSDSPLYRCGLEGLQRNARIVINNES